MQKKEINHKLTILMQIKHTQNTLNIFYILNTVHVTGVSSQRASHKIFKNKIVIKY